MKDNGLIYNIFFRIEAGYNGGRMAHDPHERFYTEIRRLFTEAGFRIEDRDIGCPDFILGKTRLYCHPESLSGPTEVRHIPQIEQLLVRGESFRFLKTDRYNKLYDFTLEEELDYYRCTYAEIIEQILLDAFHARRTNHYKYREDILGLLAGYYRIHTVRQPEGTSFDSPCLRYIREVYDSLRERGLLIEITKQDSSGSQQYYSRSINARERKSLESKNKKI